MEEKKEIESGSNLIQEGAPSEHSKGEDNPSCINSKVLFYSLTGLSVVFCILFLIFWSGAIYAFGAGWYSFLTFLLLLTMSRNIALHKNGVYKHRDATPILKYSTLVTLVVSFFVFIFLAFKAPTNGADRVMKPIFSFITLISLVGFYYILIVIPTATDIKPDMLTSFIESKAFQRASSKFDKTKSLVPDEDEEAMDTEKALKCRTCCRSCCTYFLLFLINMAGLATFIVFVRRNIYIDNDNDLLIVSNLDDSEQKMNFRCSGEGNPLVLLFHGYSGQALDMENIRLGLEDTTTVCSFSRQGYGLSEKFGQLERTSENFAIELDIALNNLNIEAEKFEDVVVVGHSMAGFNMRAYDTKFPGRIGGMVMVDPVDPELTEECFKGGISINSVYNEANARLVETGGGLFPELVGLHFIVAPLDDLPDTVESQYTSQLYRTDYFITSREEAINWGEDCEFVKDHTADYPVTVLIADLGIYEVFDQLDEAQFIQDFTSSEFKKTITLEECGHSEAVFEQQFAQVAIDEAIIMIERIKNEAV